MNAHVNTHLGGASMDMAQNFVPAEADDRALRDAFGRFATGVTVITCMSKDGPVCITANSFSSLSLEPALLMWAGDRNSRRFPHFIDNRHFAVHVLSAAQADLCFTCSKNAFALKDMPHSLSADGVPLLAGCLARFECTQFSYHEAGDHVIVVGKIDRVGMDSGDALAFYAGSFGHFAQT